MKRRTVQEQIMSRDLESVESIQCRGWNGIHITFGQATPQSWPCEPPGRKSYGGEKSFTEKLLDASPSQQEIRMRSSVRSSIPDSVKTKPLGYGSFWGESNMWKSAESCGLDTSSIFKWSFWKIFEKARVEVKCIAFFKLRPRSSKIPDLCDVWEAGLVPQWAEISIFGNCKDQHPRMPKLAQHHWNLLYIWWKIRRCMIRNTYRHFIKLHLYCMLQLLRITCITFPCLWNALWVCGPGRTTSKARVNFASRKRAPLRYNGRSGSGRLASFWLVLWLVLTLYLWIFMHIYG